MINSNFIKVEPTTLPTTHWQNDPSKHCMPICSFQYESFLYFTCMQNKLKGVSLWQAGSWPVDFRGCHRLFEELYLFISVGSMGWAMLWNNEYIPVCRASIQTNSAESDPQWHHPHYHHPHHPLSLNLKIWKLFWCVHKIPRRVWKR